MAVTIITAKQKAKRIDRREDQILGIGMALDALKELLRLKEIKNKIDKGKATPNEKRQYTRGKDKAWKKAKKAHADASKAISNGGFVPM